MRLVPTRKFERQSARMLKDLYEKMRERLTLFVHEPFHPLLDNHPLRGKWRGYRSINITGDWRIVYEPLSDDMTRLIEVGTHHDLYGS